MIDLHDEFIKCKRCEEYKPRSLFYSSAYGPRGTCKACDIDRSVINKKKLEAKKFLEANGHDRPKKKILRGRYKSKRVYKKVDSDILGWNGDDEIYC